MILSVTVDFTIPVHWQNVLVEKGEKKLNRKHVSKASCRITILHVLSGL
jgi:hypothetical protein